MSNGVYGTIWVHEDWFLYASNDGAYENLKNTAASLNISPRGPWIVSSGKHAVHGRILAHPPHLPVSGTGPGVISLWPVPTTALADALRVVAMQEGDRAVVLDHMLDLSGFSLLAAHYDALLDGSFRSRDLIRAVSDIKSHLLDSLPAPPFIDPRARQVAQRIRRNRTEKLELAEHARLAGLSPDRLRHLFMQSYGLRISQFSQWLKVHEGIKFVVHSPPRPSATEIALAGGFADAAHMAKVARRMFASTTADFRSGNFQIVPV